MEKKASLQDRLRRIRQRDARYPPEAYGFVLEALEYTMRSLGRAVRTGPERHVTGEELSHGVVRYGADRFGLLGAAVLDVWGIRSAGDIGEIVFNMVQDGLMGKSERDRREDFGRVYEDLGGAVRQAFRMEGRWAIGTSSES